jgi:drug/metabolite transporter (DMT)-like permease
MSGATWGLVAVLLTTVSAAMWGYPIVATTLVVAAAHDSAAALFLLGWSGIRGGLRAIARLIVSREAGAVMACSLLGGPVFMGGYVASMILAGPSYALTLTATYPVIGAVLADRLLRQRLTGIGWLAVVATTVGAALTAFDASSSESSFRTLLGLALAVASAGGVALEGILAYKVMITADPDAVLVLRQVFSAVLLAIAVLAVPDGLATTSALTMPDVGLPILVAGAIGGYSYATWYRAIRKIGVARAMTLNITYAMWGILLAWMIQQTSASPFAVAGCIVVVAGTCLTILSGRQRPGAHPPPDPQASAPTTFAVRPVPVRWRRWGHQGRMPCFGRAVAGGFASEWRGLRGDRAAEPAGAAAAARRGARRARPAP